jgi:hypothetical protein
MTDLNATLYPIIEAVAALMPDIVSLIVAVVPVIVVLAVAGFVIGFMDGITRMLKL